MDENRSDRGSVAERVDHLLLIEEMKRIVFDAAADGGILQIGPHAKRLSQLNGSVGLSQKSISDELIRVASQAGVPVEMNRCD